MTGTEHYDEAVRLLAVASTAQAGLTQGRKTEKELELEMRAIEWALSSAQVHAVLAHFPG
jgi:hypothetical protein